MTLHLCIINFYTDPNYSTIQVLLKIFHKIDASIKVTVLPYTTRKILNKIQSLNINAIILSGSNHRIQKTPFRSLKGLFNLEIPLLGICFGYQWMIYTLNEKIASYKDGKLHEYSKILEISHPFYVAKRRYEFSHHDFIAELPDKWIPVIQEDSQIWMAYHPDTKWVGVQFHPEKHIASGKDFFTQWIKFLLTK